MKQRRWLVGAFAAVALVPGCGNRDREAPPPTATPSETRDATPPHDAMRDDPVAAPVTIGPGVQGTCPRCLHLTAREVVWVNAGTIAAIGKDGQLTYRRLADGQLPAEDVAIDAAGVVWINKDTGEIMTVPSDGSAAPPRVIVSLGQGVRPCLALANDTVFANREGTLVAVPRKGGSPRVVARDASGPCVVADERVYFAASGQLSSAPVQGGAATPVGVGVGAPPVLVIDGGQAFWTDPSGGTVKTAALDGSAQAPQVLVTGEPAPTGLAVADGFVYFTTAAPADRGGAIKRVPRAGGGVEVVAAGEATPGAIAVDDEAVYWTTGGPQGVLRKLARPAP